MKPLAVIVHTTKYKKGGALFAHVADTLARSKSGTFDVQLQPVESKAELKAVFRELETSGKQIFEFHFIGHAGMYGPMFGTIHYPEQFSPYELQIMRIPFASNASAYFHCCRSARWFAPFFSNAHKVTAYGFH